jgi:hypothetical protein
MTSLQGFTTGVESRSRSTISGGRSNLQSFTTGLVEGMTRASKLGWKAVLALKVSQPGWRAGLAFRASHL